MKLDFCVNKKTIEKSEEGWKSALTTQETTKAYDQKGEEGSPGAFTPAVCFPLRRQSILPFLFEGRTHR